MTPPTTTLTPTIESTHKEDEEEDDPFPAMHMRGDQPGQK